MKQFAVIGNPIKHSLSPILHNWVFNFLSIKANYRKINVSKDKIPNIIEEIRNGNISGINVTIPYKESIVKYIDEINPRSMGAETNIEKASNSFSYANERCTPNVATNNTVIQNIPEA